MKLQSYLMIKCIARNTINIQELLYQLENYAQKHFPQVKLKLITNEPYWKYPECNNVIYNLSSIDLVTVSDFIKYIPVSWIYNQNLNNLCDDNALWSQNCYPEEIFLMSEVEWVNIYTWQEDKNLS